MSAESTRGARQPAVVFDVDGVLVASPHERAWQEALARLMSTRWADVQGTTYAPERFTTEVYQKHVAGKPRLSGARAALDYFHVPDAERRSREYADAKQVMIEELIRAGEFVAFDDGIRLVLALADRGVPLAAASSSKNANTFMERIPLDAMGAPGRTLRDVFAANVCGRDVPHGKPAPDLFLLAADELGVTPDRCIVVEDAASGVQAAKGGGMAALGIARLDDEALLENADADLVVTSLDDVDVEALAAGRIARAGTPPHPLEVR